MLTAKTKFLRRKTRNRYTVMQRRNQFPRLNVFRSNNNIYVQIIDDTKRATLVSASTAEKTVKLKNLKSHSNIEAAKIIGQLIAEKAKEKGIEQVVFDRGGYVYHGRIKALADAARESGLKF